MSARNEAHSLVRRRRLGGWYLGASVVLAMAGGGLQSSALSATGSIDAGTAMPRTYPAQAGRIPTGIVRPAGPVAHTQAGNPLWAIPLRVLTATRDRPLFSPSRRPPPAAVVAAPVAAPRPAAPAAPDHPLLTLVGTVVSNRDVIGIFIDQADKKVVRLRTGQDHDGWTLRAVHERDAVFDDRRHRAVLALPTRNAKGQSVDLAVNPAEAMPAGSWMDGDGQVISPPKLANGPVTRPSATPAAATWVDGDGQLVPPPSVRY